MSSVVELLLWGAAAVSASSAAVFLAYVMGRAVGKGWYRSKFDHLRNVLQLTKEHEGD